MGDEKCNVIIAEFMGMSEVRQEFHGHLYCKSLDALLPVWEKLYKGDDCSNSAKFFNNIRELFRLAAYSKYTKDKKSIESVLAYVTAELILEKKVGL